MKQHSVRETHIMNDSLLPIIFHTDFVKRRGNNSGDCIANWHENIELLCVIEGEGRIKIDAEWKKMASGDIAVINPELLHAIVSDDSVRYHCLIIDKSFCESNGIDTSSLEFYDIIKDEGIFDTFVSLAKSITDYKSCKKELYEAAAIRAEILKLLVLLCRKYLKPFGTHENLRTASSACVKQTIVYLNKHLTEDVTLDDIAEHANLSKYHLSREFRRVAGITIFEYLNILRCKEAKRLLLEGATVSEAAFACGFENHSYFSRCFKRYIGVLPSSLRSSSREYEGATKE